MTNTTSDESVPTPKVLVAYGSKNGSTAGIAEIIATVLRDEGIAADVQPAVRIRSIAGYDAVVLGGALYAGHWHRDARRFARQHVTFGGRLTDQAKGFVARAMVRNGRGGDFRNPERIQAWSRTIATALR